MIDQLPAELLVKIFEFLDESAYRKVNRFWYQIYKEKFLPKKKELREYYQWLLGKEYLDKLLQKNDFNTAVQKINAILSFQNLFETDLAWLNKELTTSSHFEDIWDNIKKSIDKVELIIEEKFIITSLESYGIGDIFSEDNIFNCGAIIIASIFNKKFGINGGKNSLLRVYAQAGFDRALDFLLANTTWKAEDKIIAFDALIMNQTFAEGEDSRFTRSIEVLLRHGTQISETMFSRTFFWQRLSYNIFALINNEFLQKRMSQIGNDFWYKLQVYQATLSDDLAFDIITCDYNLNLLVSFLTEKNLQLWSTFYGHEATQIANSPLMGQLFSAKDIKTLAAEIKEWEAGKKLEPRKPMELSRNFLTRNTLIFQLIATNKWLEKEIANKENMEIEPQELFSCNT